mgnify:CR=1 FL=1
MSGGRWYERCIAHYDEKVIDFFKCHFEDEERNCIVIAGAGFDPRSAALVTQLSAILGDGLTTVLIKEERPDPEPTLVKKAAENLENIRKHCADLSVHAIDIFADDGAVVGGRNAIHALTDVDFTGFTDVIVDMSALSMGVSYPLILYIFQLLEQVDSGINLHLALLSNPELDSAIESEPNDKMSNIHGFPMSDLYGDSDKALLWLPLLSEKKQQLHKIIYDAIKPHDTCPILPFPAEDPKKGDRIASRVFDLIQADWGGPLDNEWELDPRNFVYADERKPLDIYRTILRINAERKPVFETFGGSTIVLSPMGSKIPTLGALMAAIEGKFPVVYVESIAYNVDWTKINTIEQGKSRMSHIWLCGDAYLKADN